MRRTTPLLSVLAALALTGGPGQAQDEPAQDDQAAAQTEAAPDQADLIANAEKAAPPAIAGGATIYDLNMETVREGTNGWWCMPDDPATPTDDPMCGDENTMDWLMALINGTEPTPGKTGFSYMLAGGTTANNLDPTATEPPEGADWVRDGPHVMIMNPPADMLALYPAEAVPDTSHPYVMWGGTPYARIMVPVE